MPAKHNAANRAADNSELSVPADVERILNNLSTSTILNKFQDGVLLTLNDELIYCNEAIVEMTGYSRSEIIGKAPLDIVEEADKKRAARRIQELAYGAPEYPSEYRFRTKQGQSVPIQIFSRKLAGIGDSLLILSVLRDLTPGKLATKRVKESQLKYQVIFQNSSDPLLVVEADEGRIVDANPAAVSLLGQSDTNLKKRRLADLWSQSEDGEPFSDISDHRKRYVIFHGNHGEDQRKQILEASFSSFRSDGQAMKLVALRDITERHYEEMHRKMREERFTLAIQAGKVGIWEWDLKKSTFYIDANLKAMLGYKNREIENSYDEWMKHVYADDRENFDTQIQKHINEENDQFEFEERVMHRAGYFCWFLVRGHAIRDKSGEVLRIIGSHTDISHQKKVEEELTIHRNLLEDLVEVRTLKLRSMNQQLQNEIKQHRKTEDALKQSQQQLRDFSAKLQQAIEDERTRIAKDLHDELGQELSILQMNMALIEKMLPAGSKKLQEKVAGMFGLTAVALKKVRQIAQELRPSVLDNLGFSAAIEWQSQDFTRKTGIECTVESSPQEVSLDSERSSALFRIFQEALTNVLRHANASRIQVKINADSGRFSMTVSDNGRGITPEEMSNQKSLGLLGMRERIHPYNGQLQIYGTEGEGTVVEVVLPLRQEEIPG